MSLRALSPAGRLAKRARTNFDSDSDDDDSPKTSDDPFGGSSPLKDPPSALGKQGMSPPTPIYGRYAYFSQQGEDPLQQPKAV